MKPFAYALQRGWTIRDLRKIHAQEYEGSNAVVFPLSDYRGEYVGLHLRAAPPHPRGMYTHVAPDRKGWPWFLWLGLELRPLILVEGAFDLGWLLADGFHAAAYLSSFPSSLQLRIVRRFYKKVIFIPDADAYYDKRWEKLVYSLRYDGVDSARVNMGDFETKDVGKFYEDELGDNPFGESPILNIFRQELKLCLS